MKSKAISLARKLGDRGMVLGRFLYSIGVKIDSKRKALVGFIYSVGVRLGITERRIFIILLILSIALGVWGRAVQKRDEKTSCVIQGRGLNALPYQIGINKNIRILLTPVKGQKVIQLPKVTFNAIFDLNWNLDHWLAIESNQPKHRSCG